MSGQKYDVLIVGGGIMGSAAAYNLIKAEPRLKLAVIERDPTYAFASSALSMANVRVQFSLKENVQISQYALEFLDAFEEEMTIEDDRPYISFHHEGNLFLYDEATRPAGQTGLQLQRSLGAPVEWWSPAEIRKHYPLYEPGEMEGVFGPRDGHIDAYAVLMGYKNKARHLGASFLAAEAKAILIEGRRVVGVGLTTGEKLLADKVVNCAGPWAAEVAKSCGVDLPVLPVKRQIFALSPAVKPDRPLPLTILPSGLYFRTETGGLILVGKSFSDDPVGYEFTWDAKRWTETLWPELAEFVPAFDTMKLMRGWAGLYEVNSLDENAIIGEWPELQGFYLANGFSGHGLQQGPAVGRYLSELLLARKPTLDLSIFHPQRIIDKKPLTEGGIV